MVWRRTVPLEDTSGCRDERPRITLTCLFLLFSLQSSLRHIFKLSQAFPLWCSIVGAELSSPLLPPPAAERNFTAHSDICAPLYCLDHTGP